MYKSEFQSAVLRTKKFNLRCPDVEYAGGALLTPEKMKKFPHLLVKTVGEIGVEEVVAQCLSIHSRLAYAVEVLLDTPCYFTIGYVETSERLMFYQSEEELQKILVNGTSGPYLNMHAWLTLPTMEIIDFSLPTSYAIINETEEGIGGLIAAHADSLIGGLKYHPTLVGDDFLRKAGALVEFGI